MGNQLKFPYPVSALSNVLGLKWLGRDIEIVSVKPLFDVEAGSLCFTNSHLVDEINLPVVLIAPSGTLCESGAVIESANPRLTFAKALMCLSLNPGFMSICLPPKIGSYVKISPTAVLGNGVEIGDRTVIGHNVVISDGVIIGEDCIIKSNSVIGESGFGFERDPNGVPVRIMHLGGVVIGNRVEIGSLNTICRSTLGNTVIEDDVKTDDHVHIAHNCRVRRGALLTACVELSGGVEVGEYSWIGPNASVMQKAVLGAHSFVGIGSNVTKSVPDGAIVAGNPARIIRTVKVN